MSARSTALLRTIEANVLDRQALLELRLRVVRAEDIDDEDKCDLLDRVDRYVAQWPPPPDPPWWRAEAGVFDAELSRLREAHKKIDGETTITTFGQLPE